MNDANEEPPEDPAIEPRSASRPEKRDALFGEHFELRLPTRELLVNGRLLTVEPKVFDVLAYLIQFRERVVTKAELLDHVWRSEQVTETVVARTIMKARRALNDGEDESRFIRTVHRVGYRFCGAIREAPPSGASRDPVFQRVAILPVELHSSDSELVWVELGLIALVAHALQRLPTILVPPLQEILTALGNADAELQLEGRAAVLYRTLGVHYVMAITVRHDAAAFGLQWRLLGARPFIGEELLGTTLTHLASEAGRRAARHIAPGGAGQEALEPLGDPFVDEAYVRAMSARALQKLDDAWRYIQLCRVIPDPPLYIEVARVEIMAAREDPDVLADGMQVLQRARRLQDRQAEAVVLRGLSRYCNENLRVAQAAEFAEQGLQLTAQMEHPHLRLGAVVQAIAVRRYQRRSAETGELCREALKLAEEGGNASHQLIVLLTVANIEWDLGHLEACTRGYVDAQRLAEDLGTRFNATVAASNLARCLHVYGRMDAALVEAERTVSAYHQFGISERMHFDSLAYVVTCSVAASQIPAALAWVQQAEASRPQEGLPLEHRLNFLRAVAAWRLGHYRQASMLLEPSLGEIRSEPWSQANSWLPYAVGFFSAVIQIDAGATALVLDWALTGWVDDGWAQQARASSERDAVCAGAMALLVAALARHAGGARAAAREALTGVISMLSRDDLVAEPLRCHAALFAIWLAAEDGELLRAEEWVAQTREWMDHHPGGQLVRARLLLAHGDSAQAAVQASAALAVGHRGGEARAYFERLFTPADASRAEAAPLPSLTWLI